MTSSVPIQSKMHTTKGICQQTNPSKCRMSKPFAENRTGVTCCETRDDMDITIEGRKSQLIRCPNGHQHGKFTSMEDLLKQDLPSGHQTWNNLNYIRCLSKMIVKVNVHSVSKDRKFFDRHRLINNIKEAKTMRQGTGWACQTSDNDTFERILCTNLNCKVEDGAHDVVGPFYIITARHVVFDKSEANAAEIIFTDDLSQERIAYGVDVGYTPGGESRDFIFVKCYTHDDELINQLKSNTKELRNAIMKLYPCIEETTESKPNPGFIISHPHGRNKQISFGTITVVEEAELQFDMENGEKKRGLVRFSHDIPTCPGSSGAPVCIMDKDGARYYLAPHSRWRDGEEGYSEALVEWQMRKTQK